MNHDIKRMLELAAKAVGYSIDPDGRTDGNFVVLVNGERSMIWSPARSNQETFMLQVKLGLLVDVDWDSRTATAVVPDRADMTRNIVHIVNIPEGSDGMAETRLAVLMAAAAVGEAMP